MLDIDVTFDARKVGGTENPISVHPAVFNVPSGARERIRFDLRTLGAKQPAVFDMITPAFFSPAAPIRFEGPVPMGSTSFSVIDENGNQDSLPQRVYCTLWIRYEGQCYPALLPTIVNEPQLRPAPAEPLAEVAHSWY